jgi:hypothetical protein
MNAGSSAAAAATATTTTLSDDDVFPKPRNAAFEDVPDGESERPHQH